MGLGLGGITTPMCELFAKGLVNKLVDTQDFDQGAIEYPSRQIRTTSRSPRPSTQIRSTRVLMSTSWIS